MKLYFTLQPIETIEIKLNEALQELKALIDNTNFFLDEYSIERVKKNIEIELAAEKVEKLTAMYKEALARIN